MTTTLITGANRGLGFATARELVEAGQTVYLGARDLASAQRAAVELGGRALQLDVTDQSSVDAAAARLDEETSSLDVLINNAGIVAPGSPSVLPTADDVERLLATNVVGPARVILALLPLLRRSTAPRIVNVGSGMGSFGLTSDPSRFESTGVVPAYASSKAALHMLTSQYAKALPDIEINVVDPGYTATDMTNRQGQPIAHGIEAIVRLATQGRAGHSGLLLDRYGPLPW
jgi:NAD(P)-dependent dehydrogenase (short-subunit alcohol dehydrogenase family)